ncbi:MAG: hypothetical protein GX587_11070 [Bacteroidales bacterium]|nr:hypothetical protein [Bacteroidales bacterium]
MAEISELKKHITNYSKTKEIFVSYRDSNYSSDFFEKHSTELILHKADKEFFNKLGSVTLPSIKALNNSISELITEKNRVNNQQISAKATMKKFQVAKVNVERITEVDIHTRSIDPQIG